jgi:restriction endonuclease
MKINLAQAILELEPTSSFAVINEDLDQIEWYSEDVTQPSKADIQAKLDELQAIENANQYARDRAVAYPALAEQFDKLWHDINNGTLDNTGAFYTALKTVKDDNPKPGE